MHLCLWCSLSALEAFLFLATYLLFKVVLVLSSRLLLYYCHKLCHNITNEKDQNNELAI